MNTEKLGTHTLGESCAWSHADSFVVRARMNVKFADERQGSRSLVLTLSTPTSLHL